MFMTLYNQTYISARPFSAQTVEEATENLYTKFKAHTKFYAVFHIAFISFLILQLFSFVLFFSYLSQSTISAFAIAFFVLTSFSYFLLLFFFETKKSEQWMLLSSEFYHFCQAKYIEEKNIHLYIAEATHAAASFLQQQEFSFYLFPFSINAIAPVLEKLKVRLYWKNFHYMKELLLLLSIEELVTQIKKIPTHLDAHAALTQAYSQLGLLYAHPNKNPDSPFPWIPAAYSSEQMQEKFTLCMERSVEECKILQAYGVNDQWVHAKLATIYGLQEKTEEELLQYEELLSIDPSNEETLLHLGVLCFKQGYNAKGLNLYEQLRHLSPEKAERLISYYDSFSLGELLTLSRF